MIVWERSRRNWVLGEGSSSGFHSSSRSKRIGSKRLGGLPTAPRPRGGDGRPFTPERCPKKDLTQSARGKVSISRALYRSRKSRRVRSRGLQGPLGRVPRPGEIILVVRYKAAGATA